MKYFIFLFLLFGSMFCKAQSPNQQIISNLINSAYAEGLQNEGDSLKIDAGFHAQFKMIYKGENQELKEYPLNMWRSRQVERKANGELPRPKETSVSLKFDFVDITGDAAVAKVNYFEGTELTYIDYISLYKFQSGWKIISKIFHKIEE